ncbi:MAG TPA: hypothetical protein VMU18_04165 [Rhodoblastus sp.]|nr:hypothetical protein [Rhodoblastus sp.]
MKIARHLATLAIAAFSVAAVTGVACAEDNVMHGVKPYQGIMLDVGSKQIGGYFVQAEGRCKVTLIVADAYREDRVSSADTTMRVQMNVDAGKPAHLDTAEGKSVQLECEKGGIAMNATVLNRLAAYVPAN